MLLVFSLYTEKAVRERYIYTICACAIFVYFTGTHSVWRNVISNNCCRCLIKNSSVISHDWLDKIPFSFFHLSIVYICQFLWFFCCFFFFIIYSFFQLCQQRFLVSVYQRFLEAKQPSECHTALLFFLCLTSLGTGTNPRYMYESIQSWRNGFGSALLSRLLLRFLDRALRWNCSNSFVFLQCEFCSVCFLFSSCAVALAREREIEREGK